MLSVQKKKFGSSIILFLSKKRKNYIKNKLLEAQALKQLESITEEANKC